MNEFKINKYLSELKNKLSALIEEKDKLLLVSPTESGKTRFVLKYINANPTKRIALLTPTQSLTNNIKRDSGDIRCGYGTEFIHSLGDNESFVSTWDSLANNYFIKNSLDVVFIDEAHLIAGHSGFRRICKTILDYKKKIVYMTGTPEVIENIYFLKGNKIEVTNCNRYKRNYNLITTENQPIDTAKNIIRNSDRKKLTIIRLNNKSNLRELFDCYSKSYNVALYYSDERETNELENIQGNKLCEIIKLGNIPKDVDILLATSIVDAGLTLNVERDVDCHAIANQYMPNAIDMCQLAYRVRTDKGNLKLNIYGRFGDDLIEDSEIRNKNTSNTIAAMESRYNNYSKIDYFTYIGLLQYYGLEVYKETKEDKFITKKSSRTSDYEIIMNLKNSFNKEYQFIYNHCIYRNKESWLDVFDSNETIIKTNKRVGNAKLEGVKSQLIKAIDYCIDFKLLLNNNRFERKRLDNLANAVSNYKRIVVFKYLADEVIFNYYVDTDKLVIDNFKSRFNELNKLEQESFKTLTNLLFNVSRYDRERLILKSKNTSEDDKSIKCYLNSFYEEYRMVS